MINASHESPHITTSVQRERELELQIVEEEDFPHLYAYVEI